MLFSVVNENPSRLRYCALQASITSISRPHELPDRYFAPYRRLC
jgi:hypothetical protein